MEAYKSLIKNLALFLFIGAIPSIGWASGYFLAFSWASLFLLLGGCFSILWLKERQNTQTLKNILLTRDDAWALCEGDQILDHSPFFPSRSLQSFKEFVHPDVLQEVESAINELIHKNFPFKLKIHAAKGNAIYSFEGEPLKGKVIFWLRNITESTYLERIYMENLQEKERLLNKLQVTLDKLPILIWHRDQDQKITYCNAAYSEAVGVLPQVVQREGIELIQPRAAKILARKAINTNEHQFFESTAIAEEENRHFRICEIPNALEDGTLGVAFDVTELKDAEEEIKNLVDAHDEVLAHLSTAIAIYDASGTLQYYNQSYVNLNSFDEEFLKTSPCLDEVLEELRSRRQLPEYADFPAYKKKCLQQLTEQMEPIEEMMHLPDERTLRNFSAPHPMGGLLFMYEDVTNYLSLERNNKTLFNSYQVTLDNLFEGVIVIGSNNRLEIFNPSFLYLWNLKEEDVNIGQHLNIIVEKLKNFFDYQDDWDTYKAQFIESVTDRVPKTGQIKRKDGVILNFGYVPLPNGSHLISYADTTDTCRVQQVLQERNEALETADRLKSEFIESVSYELKSPINTVIGFTEILKNRYFGDLNEKQADYVDGILESSTKLLHLVNDILDLASIEAGHLTLNHSIVEIPLFLQIISQIISKRAEENKQHIIIKCDKMVNTWVADERRLKQALLNLLSDALRFTPCNGKIIIEANIIQDELLLSVTDTSIGLEIDEQVRMLDKFKGEKGNRHTGSGIGISLVKNIIELHGGRIELFSEINKGTTISCFLPRIPLQNHMKESITFFSNCKSIAVSA
jgi:signal transduction histidine kinase